MSLDLGTKSGIERAHGELNHQIGELRASGQLTADKVVELGAKLEEFQRASLEIANRRNVDDTIGTDERELVKRYVRPDGSVRLMSETITKEFAGERIAMVAPGLLDDEQIHAPIQREVRAQWSKRNLVRLALRKGERSPVSDGKLLRALDMLPKPVRDGIEGMVKPHARQFFGTTRSFNDSSTEGAEWIQDGFIPDLYRNYELPSDYSNVFDTMQVSTDTILVPKLTTGARPYLLSKITDDNPANYTPSSPATDSSSIAIPGMAVRILADAISMEDAALNVASILLEELQRADRDGYNDAWMNGDTAATHQDTIASWNIRSRWGSTGLGGSADHRRGMIGLRARAYDVSNTTDQSASQTAAGHLADMATLGERAAGELVTFVSPEYMVSKMMGWSETLTAEKFGPNASILRGALVAVFGQPVFMTRWISADLATTGLYTGTGSYTGKVIAARQAFKNYVRRGAVIESKKEISSQHFEYVLTSRRLLATLDSASTKNVHFAFKLG